MKTDKEIFQEAYALVKNPDTWCQGHYALTKGGAATVEDDEAACRWCSVGALWKAHGGRVYESNVLFQLEKQAKSIDKDLCVMDVNDCRDHDVVCDLWEKVGRDNGWL